MSRIPQERYAQFLTSLETDCPDKSIDREELAHRIAETDSKLIPHTDPNTAQQVLSRVTGGESASSHGTQWVAVELGAPFSDDPSRSYGHVDAPLSILAGEALTKERYQTIPIIRVGTPGINYLDKAGQHNELTVRQKRELHRGSFSSIGQVCARALVTALEHEHLEQRKIILLQRSMSVAIGAAAIHELAKKGINIEGIALSEGVTYEPRNLIRLVANFMATGSDAAQYLAQNPALCQENNERTLSWAHRTARDGATNVRYGKALAKGGFFGDLLTKKSDSLDTLQQHKSRIILINGESSRLSTTQANDVAAESLAQANVDVSRFIWPHGANHGLTMTLGNDLKAIELLTQQS